jgi:lipopolysaccharide assembly outer membrane protein LptD (OstA)
MEVTHTRPRSAGRRAAVVRRLAAALAGAGLGAARLAVPAAAQPPAPPPAAAAAAAAAPADSVTRIYNVEAGRLSARREGGGQIVDLEGGVRLESEGTTVESQRARDDHERQHVYFYGDVRVRDADVTMTGEEGEFDAIQEWAELRRQVRITDPRGLITADRARYWRDLRLLRLWGHVDFRDEATRVQADSVVYREDTGLGEVFGTVVITDIETGSTAMGTHGFYDRNTGEARLEPRPTMVIKQSGQKDTQVSADQSRSNRDRSVLRLRGNVRIARGNTMAGADSAILWQNENRAELRGRPWLEQGDTRMTGERIDVHSRGDEVDRVLVFGFARLVQTRADTMLVKGPNTVQGDSAVLYFEDGEMKRAVVTGRAASRFVPEESRPNRVSVNEAQADSIVILFADEETEEVLFVGHAAGTYRYYEGDLEALQRPREVQFDTTFGVVRGDTTGFDFERQSERVLYRAERILYLAPQNDLHLQEAAEVEYEDRLLRAGRIHFDADTDLLDAREDPVLVDAGERMYGDVMGYDMNTRRAWIESGSTQYDMGYYTGRLVRKTREGELQVSDASYTTCDLAHPHYQFKSDQMKIYIKDKVVGRPVKLYLGNVPVGYLPFIVNSVNTDRHSGFLQPDIEFGIGGSSRFIRGLDYYWAASSYFDVLLSGEYNERQRPSRSSLQSILADTLDTRNVRFQVNTRYKVRYRLDGDIGINYQRQIDGSRTHYTIGGSHRQLLGEYTRLNGNVDYASNETARRVVNENLSVRDALERKIASGFTLSRNRPGALANFTVSVNRTQILDPDRSRPQTLVSRTLPSFSINFRTIHLAPAPKGGRGSALQRFLHSLQLNPNLNVSRVSSDALVSKDSTELAPGDTTAERRLKESRFETVTASTGAALGRQTNLWIFKVNPSIAWSESYRRQTPAPPNEQRSTRSLGGNLSASTTFYGLFYPKRWGLTAIRHRIDPSASTGYTFLGTATGGRAIGLSLGNTIDVKYERDGKERRLDGLFDWRLTTSYLPTALGPPGQPDRKFGTISSFITINRPGPLTLTISQDYDPYTGRILRTQIPFAFKLSGRFGYGDTGLEAEERNRVVREEGAARDTSAAADTTGASGLGTTDAALRDVEPVRVGRDGSLAWEMSMSYQLRRFEGRTDVIRVPFSLGIQLTRNWHVKYTATWDGAAQEFASPAISVTRDLHCWKASFSRILYGDEWRYYFRIFVDRHQDDLFLESGERSVRYGY